MKNLQKGSIIPAMIIIVLILTLGGGTYVYLESKKVSKIETDSKEIVVTATSTIPEENLMTTPSPETKTDTNSTSTIVKGGTKTVTKSATSTTSTLTGNDGSKSSITIDKEEEEYIKKNTTYSCGNESCFNESFKNCSPGNVSVNMGGFMGSVYYEIKNKTQNGCNLAFKYTEYPDPDWVNKEMVCEVNNKIDFQSTIEEMFSSASSGKLKCTGKFYDIIKPN